jgi:hypothetical protein
MMNRRRLHLVGTVWLAVLAAPAIPAFGAGPGRVHKHVHFTEHITGASISASQSVYRVHDSIAGNGAGTQIAMLNGTATGGTDTETTYYGDATATSHGTFTLGTPNTQGVAKLTGSGHDTSGTGRLKGLKSSYRYTGTYNLKTTVYSVTLKGTESY